jgi:hypothetical protein
METIILKNIVRDSSSNEEGVKLFNILQAAYSKKEHLLLQVDSDLTMSSSFLNTSIGLFLDKYGLNTFRNTVKFKGSKTQFSRLSNYITEYNNIYLA